MSGMKMAKASEKDIEAALVLMGILTDVDSGYYPRYADPDAEPDENEPTFFDPDDEEHLRIFYDRIKETLDRAPGCLGRVIGGFHTLMHNDIVNPDLDHLELHPRLVAALATVEEKKSQVDPVPVIDEEKDKEATRIAKEMGVVGPGKVEKCEHFGSNFCIFSCKQEPCSPDQATP